MAQTNDKTFRVNDSERLVLDEQTRLNMEALFARTEHDRLAEAKQQAIEPLPAAAGAQAAELLAQYDNYQQAQRQAYPPGVAPATEEAALAELDGLHALRVAHFGPLVARALYGEEEAVSRQLVELMRLEKDQSLTMEEKAVRAQQLRDSLPTRTALSALPARKRGYTSPRMKLSLLSRSLHKWLALFVGVQLLIWAVTGFYMVAIDLDFIHGDPLVRNLRTPVGSIDDCPTRLAAHQPLSGNHARLAALAARAELTGLRADGGRSQSPGRCRNRTAAVAALCRE